MDFKKFVELVNSDDPEIIERRKKVAEGFAERQRLRNIKFAEEAKMLEPSAEWYERSYNI